MRVTHVVSFVAVVSCYFGCKSNSGENAATQESKSLDACSFITESEASAAFGVPVKLVRRDPQICAIDLPGGSDGRNVSALVDVRAATDVWDLALTKKPAPVRVNGLGEQAGWSDATHGGSPDLIKLYVVKNGKTLSVTLTGSGVDNDAMKLKVQALATAALPHM